MAIRREAAAEAEAATTQLPPRGAKARTDEEEGGGEQSTKGASSYFPPIEIDGMECTFICIRHSHTQWEGREMMEVASYEGACKYVYGDRLKGGP